MGTTDNPRPAEDFVHILLASHQVVAACAAEPDLGGPDAVALAKAGDTARFVDWFNEWRCRNHEVVSVIRVANPAYSDFDICIHRSGPLYWIHIDEFDDICYFASERDASAYARREFSDYIDD